MASSKEDFLKALAKADEAGDTEAAKAIAEEYKKRFGGEQTTPEEEPGIAQNIKAGVVGATQGLTFGLGDEIAAAHLTKDQLIQEGIKNVKAKGLQGIPDTLATIGDKYNNNVKMFRKAIDQIESEHPVSYTTGDIAGSIASSIASGGTGSVFGAGLKAGAKTLGISAVQGAAHGYARGEGETIGQHLANAGLGAVTDVGFTAGGAALGKGLAKAGSLVGQKMGGESFLNYLGAHSLPVRRKVTRNLRAFKQDATEWAQRMTNYTTKSINEKGEEIVEPLIHGGRNPDDLIELFKKEQNATNEAIESVMQGMGELQMEDSVRLYNSLHRSILKPMIENAGTKKSKRVAAESVEWLKGELFDTVPNKAGDGVLTIPAQKTVKDLQKLKKSIYQDEDATTPFGKMAHGVASKLNDYIKDSVNQSKELSPEAIESFNYNWRRSGDLSNATQAVNAKIAHEDGNSVVNLFNSFMSTTSLGTLAVASLTGSWTYAPAIALGVQKLATHPKIAAPLTNGLFKISNAFKRNPERWEQSAMQLASASALGSDAFDEALMQVSAEVDLATEPLVRTTSEVIRRKESILTRLENSDPEKADQLRKAIKENDEATIRGMMSAMAENSTKGLIEKGMGWDGMAVTESEVKKVKAWISSIGDLRKRRDLTKQFDSSGAIPQEMLQGGSGQAGHKQFIYQKARDKVRNPEY